MLFNEQNSPNKIPYYTKMGVSFDGKLYAPPVLLYSDQVLLTKDFAIRVFSDVCIEKIQAIYRQYSCDVFLLGADLSLCSNIYQIIKQAHQQHIALDIMNSAAACRAYSILLSEQRNVTMLLF